MGHPPRHASSVRDRDLRGGNAKHFARWSWGLMRSNRPAPRMRSLPFLRRRKGVVQIGDSSLGVVAWVMATGCIARSSSRWCSWSSPSVLSAWSCDRRGRADRDWARRNVPTTTNPCRPAPNEATSSPIKFSSLLSCQWAQQWDRLPLFVRCDTRRRADTAAVSQ